MKSANQKRTRQEIIPPAWQAACISVFLVLAVFAVFGQTARFDFICYDDAQNVYENPVVRKGLSLSAVGWAFTHTQVVNWIPLTTLSHILDCQMFGLVAGGHHLVNVLWHAANVVLLFLALRQMTGCLWRSAFVAALFAIHPLRAESVAWVSERKDVLSGFFFLVAILAYIRQTRAPSRGGRLAVVILFGLGLLAKSMVATLPLVLLLLDYWPLGRCQNPRQLIYLVKEKIPLFAVAAVSCLATALVPGLVVTDAHQIPLLARLGDALVSYVVYLRRTVFPEGLAIPYPLRSGGPPIWEAGLALLVLAAISAVVVAWRKKSPYWLTGWLWYLGMLAPVIGIIQISQDSIAPDRYTYLPGIGLAMAVTWAVAEGSAGWKYRPVILGGLMVAVIGALGVGGYVQTAYWKDDQTLWTRALACTSDNYVAHNNMATGLARHGKLEEAIAQYHASLEIMGGNSEAHFDLANTLSKLGETNEAVAEYHRALGIAPNYAQALNNLGNILATQGADAEAADKFRKALDLQPGYGDAHYNLGNSLFRLGQVDEAITEYRKALDIAPENAEAHTSLGTALALKNEDDEAIAQYQKALALQPEHAGAHFNLGNLYLKHGKLDEAVAQLRQAVAIKPDSVEARTCLGRALLFNGDPDGAMACFENTAVAGPDAAAKWESLGRGFLQNNDIDTAVLCLRQAAKIAPGSAEVLSSLGMACFKNGEIKAAIDSWQQALEIAPDQINIEANLAWLLSTAADASLRNGTNAVALAARANQLSGGGNPGILETLAAAYAEAGNYEQAKATAQRALELAVGQNKAALSASLQNQIKLYQANTPLRNVAQ